MKDWKSYRNISESFDQVRNASKQFNENWDGIVRPTSLPISEAAEQVKVGDIFGSFSYAYGDEPEPPYGVADAQFFQVTKVEGDSVMLKKIGKKESPASNPPVKTTPPATAASPVQVFSTAYPEFKAKVIKVPASRVAKADPRYSAPEVKDFGGMLAVDMENSTAAKSLKDCNFGLAFKWTTGPGSAWKGKPILLLHDQH